MRARNVVAIILTFGSFAVLIPGLTKDLITLSASMTFMGNRVQLFEETRSIVGTVRSLHESGNDFVAGLILFFSIIVPFLKGIMFAASLMMRDPLRRWRLFAFTRSISKWAMADVFVVGVYVAFLSAKATEMLDAVIRPGFYWFVSYCLISLAALQTMHVDQPARSERAPSQTLS